MKIGFDTNVLVYAFDTEHPERRAQCKRSLDRVFDGHEHGVVTAQVLAEFAFVMTCKVRTPYARSSVAEFINAILASENWTVLSYDHHDVLNVLDGDGPFWDSLIASTFLRDGIRTIVTYNGRDFAKSGLTVRIPA
jgi:predicted nucleic acid-binding protein